MTITEKLRLIRKNNKLKQQQVAEYLGYRSRNGYWSIEKGLTKLKAEQVCNLARLYNVSVDYFLYN